MSIQIKPQTNLLAKAGISERLIKDRIEEDWHTIRRGPPDQRLIHDQGPDMAYMLDTGNLDVRTEGMSYGMMMAVLMNDKDSFDRLWRWSCTKLQHKDGEWKHYFAWSASPDGTWNAKGPAPDGEEYFAMALFMASRLWGDGPAPLDYAAQARTILRACVHKGEAGHGPGNPMWEPSNHLIKFTPECPWSDPSYHLPHFYECFAEWADPEDRAFWNRAALASRDYIHLSCHPVTGLCPEYADYDGTPHKAPWDYGHHHFYSDSYRLAANCGLDHAWFRPDPRHEDLASRIIRFFHGKDLGELRMYAIDGTPLDEPALHPHGLVATVAQAALACPDEAGLEAVRRFWYTSLRTGPRRYYDNCLQFFALLALAGRYRVP